MSAILHGDGGLTAIGWDLVYTLRVDLALQIPLSGSVDHGIGLTVCTSARRSDADKNLQELVDDEVVFL